MSETLYLGVRAEVAKRFVPSTDVVEQYNNSHANTKIFDLHHNGKITADKSNSVVIAHGEKYQKGTTGLVNFAVMTDISSQKDIVRVVQIINVLGNDRLIREKVSLFAQGKSLLNSIPELRPIKDAFVNIEKIMPGFIKSGWYYAPEAMFE